MELGKTIMTLRNEKGYTQERLADMLGVSTAAVSKWECANAYPDITLLPKIAEIFNVSVDYLLGYDMTYQKTISEIVAEANELRRELKGDEAEALIKKTLARYPNNLQLKFELARHKLLNARYKSKKERDRLLSEAAKGFEYVAEHDEDEKRRAWSLHFLTTINLIHKDYDKAAEYNAKLFGFRGLYPRVTAAVIEMNKAPGEDALHSIESCIYECIYQISLLIPWLTQYLLNKGDYDAVIRECLRAAKVYEEFVDCGWIYRDLSECYETAALAYAEKQEYDLCLDYLEKACDCAVNYDNLDYELTYNVYDIPDEVEMSDEKISSRRLMYQALLTGEREAYAPIRNTERYKEILRKLTEEKVENK